MLLFINQNKLHFHSSGMFRLVEERVKWDVKAGFNLIIHSLTNEQILIHYEYWYWTIYCNYNTKLKNIKSLCKISILIFLYSVFITLLMCRNNFIVPCHFMKESFTMSYIKVWGNSYNYLLCYSKFWIFEAWNSSTEDKTQSSPPSL